MYPSITLTRMISLIWATVLWPQDSGPVLQQAGCAVFFFFFFFPGSSSTCLQISEMKVFHLNKYQSGNITMATRNKSFLRWKKGNRRRRGVNIYFTLNKINASLIDENSL